MDGVDLSRYWGNDNFGLDWVEATGRSSGLVSLWDNKKFDMISVLLGSVNGMVIVGGDFNCVRDKEERRNSKFNLAMTNDFNEFLEEAGLHEFNLRGRKFTYVVGNKCSRIDRIFVSWCVMSEWSNAEYRALARDCSDHSPLILKVEDRNYGPKPFKFFNSWLQRKEFDELVTNTSILVSKEKSIKDEAAEYTTLAQDLADLDEVVEDRDFTEAEQWVYEEAKVRIKELEDFKQKDIRQKSRVRWAKEGDENTRYFHGIINKRKVSNSIPGLLINGEWVTVGAVVC
ncbi:uncharacterized protein LOC110933657 [Helianthus annuus]|uniref:uncharacterized protein LOC110933657 n=1 Tax=Helianthus annuus TaxID=4232 RepID=UPI00165339CC|nr:uncharacterized protein LOC110933657 [Helianthus annuus]